MKLLLRKVFFSLFLLFSLAAIWQCRMVIYGAQQGMGQLRIVNQARPIAEVMADPEFPDSLKSKLLLVEEIRRFAIDSLGINDSENYQAVYDQKGEPILWVVTACDKYALNEYRWRYPVLGALGYKGFFKKERAIREAEKFERRGFDTDIGDVSAWSTLGWFKDPILSGMLERSEGGLARLIIHELTHATLFVKGNAEYNENLATFVGDNGAELFLIHKYGEDSDEYRDYLGGISDIRQYGEHILRGGNRLDSLYNTFTPETPVEDMERLKTGLIKEIMTDGDTLSLYDREPFAHLFNGEYEVNNTFFIGFRMYRQEQNTFQQEFENDFGSDFKRYLAYLKEKYPSV